MVLMVDVYKRQETYFLSRLSLLVAQKVPTVWNTCTMSTSSTTQTIMMLV